ncbi:hypothetical protein S83_061893, partial [Arachis hypogaea]
INTSPCRLVLRLCGSIIEPSFMALAHKYNQAKMICCKICPFHHLVNYDTIIDVASSSEDAIDALDIVEEHSPFDDTSNDDDTADAEEEPSFIPLKVSGYFFYYVDGTIKKAFTK